MSASVRIEEIYEAATDATLFAGLAARLADGIGARSGVLHWRPQNGGHEEVSYSGYFSAEQMQVYAEHFAGDDLWSAAFSDPLRADRVWRLDHLVCPKRYESGRLYNEWLRPMGDDSFHALGGALPMGPIQAEFGFHRGRSQAAFGQEEVSLLSAQLEHLRHMLAIRYRLWAAERSEALRTEAQDLIGDAILTVSGRGALLQQNRAAEALLECGDALRLRAGRVLPASAADREAFAAMLHHAGTGRGTGAVLVRSKAGDPHLVSMVSSRSAGERRIVLVVRNPRQQDTSVRERLRFLYQLTAAEADVAIGLAAGETTTSLAAQRNTALETVRNQIKSISAKLGCSRQTEIVALIASVPKLNVGHGR